MKQFIILFTLLFFGKNWGQTDVCDGIKININQTTMAYKTNETLVEPENQIFNISNTFQEGNYFIYLKTAFDDTQSTDSGSSSRRNTALYFGIDLLPWLKAQPKSDGNYPDGENTDRWDGIANKTSGSQDSDAPKVGTHPGRWPQFNRFEGNKYIIAIKRSSLSKTPGSNENPVYVKLKIDPNIYKKNEKMTISMRVFRVYQKRAGLGTTTTTGYCGRNIPNHFFPIFTIDLIRPTFPSAPADQTFKVDEPLEIQLSAEDRDEQNQKIPQKLKTDAPTDPLDILHEHIEDGVFTSVVSVKKLHPLAGGGTEKEDRGITLPRGLYINQLTQKIEGTPTEEGTFEISMTTTDAAGNGQQEGNGTPQNWNSTPQTFTLTITPRMGLVNPNMRMRVAQ